MPVQARDLDDLVAACIAAIERPVSGVFNVGDGDHASTTAFLQETARLAGLPPPRLVSLAEAPPPLVIREALRTDPGAPARCLSRTRAGPRRGTSR